jgi:hypothetical protein
MQLGIVSAAMTGGVHGAAECATAAAAAAAAGEMYATSAFHCMLLRGCSAGSSRVNAWTY